MRLFFFQSSVRIQQTPSDELVGPQKSPTASGQLAASQIFQSPTEKSGNPFTLSWSHYVLPLTIKNADERSFYQIKAANEGWSLSELKAPKGIQPLPASRAQSRQERDQATSFWDWKNEPATPNPIWSRPSSRTSSTFCWNSARVLFEARQRRFTFDEDHYFVDLVFYNRLLLCQSKKQTIVELTLPKDANIHAREYELSFAVEGSAHTQAPRMDARSGAAVINLKTVFEKFDHFTNAPDAVAKMRELEADAATSRARTRHFRKSVGYFRPDRIADVYAAAEAITNDGQASSHPLFPDDLQEIHGCSSWEIPLVGADSWWAPTRGGKVGKRPGCDGTRGWLGPSEIQGSVHTKNDSAPTQ